MPWARTGTAGDERRRSPLHNFHRLHLFDGRAWGTPTGPFRPGGLDVMIAGGVDAPIAPLILRGFMAMRILASEWNGPAGAGLPPILARPRRVCYRRRFVVFRAGKKKRRVGTGSGRVGRNRGLWIHLRGVSPGTPGGVRRRAGSGDFDGPGGWRRISRSRRLFELSWHVDGIERPH